jgi:acyl phosphate:glycerol-3-phosphate acyltransferase
VSSFALACLMTGAGFLSGSLPFSVWLVRLRGRDARSVGDGNPGAINAFRAGGARAGIPALLLDFLKGALPVAAAFWLLGVRGWLVLPVAIAPVLGHAFSPFLGFRGGKAIAVTFGIWTGITLWQGPCLLGAVFLLGKFIFRLRDAWTVLLGTAALLAAAVFFWREPALAALAVANAAVLGWKHRREIRA